MSYASIDDARIRYGDELILTLCPATDEDTPDHRPLNRGLIDATDEIDGYLGARYTLPIEPAPDILKRLCVDIALYRVASEADMATEERRLRYKDAVKMLESISKGTVTLGLPDPEPKTVHGVRTSGSPPRFGRGSMSGLRI